MMSSTILIFPMRNCLLSMNSTQYFLKTFLLSTYSILFLNFAYCFCNFVYLLIFYFQIIYLMIFNFLIMIIFFTGPFFELRILNYYLIAYCLLFYVNFTTFLNFIVLFSLFENLR